MFELFREDYYRYTGSRRIRLARLLKDHSLRYLMCLRGGTAIPSEKTHADKVRA